MAAWPQANTGQVTPRLALPNRILGYGWIFRTNTVEVARGGLGRFHSTCLVIAQVLGEMTTRWSGPGILRRKQEIIQIGIPKRHVRHRSQAAHQPALAVQGALGPSTGSHWTEQMRITI